MGISIAEANKIIDTIVCNVIHRLNCNEQYFGFIIDRDKCIVNGKIHKDCAVVGYDTLNDNIIQRDFHASASHSSKLALVDAAIAGESNETIIRMMLVALLHQLFEVEMDRYRRYSDNSEKFRSIYFIVNDMLKALFDEKWFNSKSKKTYPFDIPFDLYNDARTQQLLIYNLGEVVIDILVETIKRYRILLIEIDRHSNESVLVDFMSFEHKKELANSLTGVLNIK